MRIVLDIEPSTTVAQSTKITEQVIDALDGYINRPQGMTEEGPAFCSVRIADSKRIRITSEQKAYIQRLLEDRLVVLGQLSEAALRIVGAGAGARRTNLALV